ncbi:flagellar FliL protein [Desulfobaculum xiamenense]|uniref:Flagellar protein FliL n=1 Tax=Desulfobaculum xiamenense TaxID=995050 RepID=A0A846QKS3_9BACT|nr:flagellar basal body-associated FliL family protein [Desulfobaculum xiamenense]NJB67052.1 flagellar FliL protein [Desulfobaculum xiamenense]
MIDELEDLLNGDDAAKAELDTDELNASLPRESQKVELDLEDAPFLDEEEEEEEEPQPEAAAPAPVLEEAGEKGPVWFKNLRIVIPAAAALLLVVAGLSVWLFMRQPAPPEAEPEATTEEVIPAEEQPMAVPEGEMQEFLVAFEPFWVEQRDTSGNVRFLVCRFSTVTDDEKLSFEVAQKMVILRDAIFYYLKNKDLTYLADTNNAEALKADILSVMNQYLSTGRIETLLIEEYLVK